MPISVGLAALLLSGCSLGPNPSQALGLVSSPPPLTEQAVRQVAAGFFQGYLDCMTDPPAAATGKVGDYCQANNGFATGNLPANLEAGGVAAAGADPITCGQNPPNGFDVEAVTISGDTARAVVVAGYQPEPLEIRLSIVAAADGPLVDDVRCPAP